MMTDSADYRRVKETEALAKRHGFKLDHRIGSILLITTSGWPSTVFGKNKEIVALSSIEEVRSYISGWANCSSIFEKINLDAEEFKKRIEDNKILKVLGKRKTK